MKNALLALTISFVMVGCVTTSVTPLTGKTYPPVNEKEVAIYLKEADVPGDYEKIAVIYARGDYAMTDEARMFEKVRKKAAKLGANGVLLQQITEPSTGAKIAQAFLNTEANRKGEMVAIFVRPSGESSAEGPEQ